MTPIRVDLTGVGNYNAEKGKIEAEDYFEAFGIVKKKNQHGGFSISDIDHNDYLIFPNIQGLPDNSNITLQMQAYAKGKIEVRADSPHGKLLGEAKVKKGAVQSKITFKTTSQNLCLIFKGTNDDFMELDGFLFDN